MRTSSSMQLTRTHQDLRFTGHFTFECKGARPYISRPSRTQQLQNPKIAAKVRPTVEVPEEFLKQPYVLESILVGAGLLTHKSTLVPELRTKYSLPRRRNARRRTRARTELYRRTGNAVVGGAPLRTQLLPRLIHLLQLQTVCIRQRLFF